MIVSEIRRRALLKEEQPGLPGLAVVLCAFYLVTVKLRDFVLPSSLYIP